MPRLAEVLPPSAIDPVTDAIKKAFAKGREAGRTEGREEVMVGLRAVAHLNGSFDTLARIGKAGKFDESHHPRDDHGRFVSKEDLSQAASDPAKAAELRDRVTDPEQRKKLEAAIGEGGGKPAEKPGQGAKTRTVDETHALVKKLMGPGGPSTPETVAQLTEAFKGHTHAELAELKQRLGIKASGPKAEQARKIAERAASTTRDNRQHYDNPRVTVGDAHRKIQGHLDAGELDNPEVVRDVAKMLREGLSVRELKELKTRLGVKASGNKYEVAKKLAERAAQSQAKPATPEVSAIQPKPDPSPRVGSMLGSGDREKMTLDVPDRHGGENAFDVRTIKNPTAEDIEKVVLTYGRGSNLVKGLIDGDNVYIWNPGDEEVHHQPMAEALGIKGLTEMKDRLNFQWDSDKGKPSVWASPVTPDNVKEWAAHHGFLVDGEEVQAKPAEDVLPEPPDGDAVGAVSGPLAAVSQIREGVSDEARGYIDVALDNTVTEGRTPDEIAAQLARRLASSWREAHELGASSEVIAEIDRAMEAAGTTRHGGESGETVPYDGSVHAADGPVSDGQPVMVVHPAIKHGTRLVQSGKVTTTPAITPAEHLKRLGDLDPRDAGAAPDRTPAPGVPTDDDHAMEARRAAGDKLGRMEGWAAARPESLAAEEAAKRAGDRVTAVGGGEPDAGGTTGTAKPDLPKPVEKPSTTFAGGETKATDIPVLTATDVRGGSGWEPTTNHALHSTSGKTRKEALERAAQLQAGGGTGSPFEYAVVKQGGEWAVYKKRRGPIETPAKSAPVPVDKPAAGDDNTPTHQGGEKVTAKKPRATKRGATNGPEGTPVASGTKVQGEVGPKSVSVSGLSDAEFAKTVQSAADAQTHGFGDNKVFISDVYDSLKKQDPSLTEAEFKKRLMAAHNADQMDLSRADLVQEMDPDRVARSLVQHPAGRGEFHFIRVAPRDRASASAQPAVKPTANVKVTGKDLAAAVGTMKGRLRTDSTFGTEGVNTEIAKFAGLPLKDVQDVLRGVGMQDIPSDKAKALKKLAKYITSVQAGFERSDA